MIKNICIALILFVVSSISFAQNKPNIIFILADDLGYGDVGFNGQDKIKTPVLDNMASQGIVFTNHYAGSTVCGPSRTSLMTGLHSGHSPIRENPRWTKSGKPASLDPNQITVARELKRAGYTTGIIGKWGLAENLDAGLPNKQGFDYFYGFNTHGAAHHYYPEKLWENDQLIELEGNVMMDKIGRYTQDLFTEKALNFIDKNQKEPFFLYLAYTIPHYELTIPEDEKVDYYKEDWPLREMKMGHYRNDKNGHVTYASMVTRMDKDIGIVMEKLKELGIDGNTLVIFTSDNGHEYDKVKDEFFNSNGNFRGKKRDLYEGGVHVPFVAVWPGKIKPATKSNHVSAFWDLLPTVCDIAKINPSAEVDGISYLPSMLNKKQKEHDYLYWEFNERRGPMQALLKDDWKLVRFVGKQTELYNLKNDPGEQNNVYNQNPKMAKKLEILMDEARTDHPEFPLVKMN
jgi:arylsulfatase A-like enzyme